MLSKRNIFDGPWIKAETLSKRLRIDIHTAHRWLKKASDTEISIRGRSVFPANRIWRLYFRMFGRIVGQTIEYPDLSDSIARQAELCGLNDITRPVWEPDRSLRHARHTSKRDGSQAMARSSNRRNTTGDL